MHRTHIVCNTITLMAFFPSSCALFRVHIFPPPLCYRRSASKTCKNGKTSRDREKERRRRIIMGNNDSVWGSAACSDAAAAPTNNKSKREKKKEERNRHERCFCVCVRGNACIAPSLDTYFVSLPLCTPLSSPSSSPPALLLLLAPSLFCARRRREREHVASPRLHRVRESRRTEHQAEKEAT